MDLLVVSATAFEIAPLQDYLEKEFVEFGPFQYQRGDLQVSLLITGVGLPLTAYALGRLLSQKRFDLALNAGIAGSFRRDWPLGQVVQVISERFADLGVEEADGSFRNVHELGLIPPDQEPFQDGLLRNPEAEQFHFLPQARGISVNRVHGFPPSIEQVLRRDEADVESMEGAAFFYACLLSEVPFLEIRSLSNYVEARNRANWRIDLAIERLNATLIELLQTWA